MDVVREMVKLARSLTAAKLKMGPGKLDHKATILRFKPDQLKKLGSLDKVRWVEFDRDGVHIGIEGTWID